MRHCATAGPFIGLAPNIIYAIVVDHGVLRLGFADGLSGDFEVLGRMRGPVFERPRTLERFAEGRSILRATQ